MLLASSTQRFYYRKKKKNLNKLEHNQNSKFIRLFWKDSLVTEKEITITQTHIKDIIRAQQHQQSNQNGLSSCHQLGGKLRMVALNPSKPKGTTLTI